MIYLQLHATASQIYRVQRQLALACNYCVEWTPVTSHWPWFLPALQRKIIATEINNTGNAETGTFCTKGTLKVKKEQKWEQPGPVWLEGVQNLERLLPKMRQDNLPGVLHIHKGFHNTD